MAEEHGAEPQRASGSDRSTKPQSGGDHVRKAREWGGGAKGAKGPVTSADRANENSSARR